MKELGETEPFIEATTGRGAATDITIEPSDGFAGPAATDRRVDPSVGLGGPPATESTDARVAVFLDTDTNGVAVASGADTEPRLATGARDVKGAEPCGRE